MTITETTAPTVSSGGNVAAIVTEGLTKVYPGDIRAVDNLDLVVERGEIFGLLGPNGAGKTTTAGMLTTRVIPTAGTATVGGIDVVKSPAEAKRLIGVVPQTNTLDRSLSVWENLYFHGRFFGMDAKTAQVRGDSAARTVPPHRARRGAGHGALRRHGATAHGRSRRDASAFGALPRRADRGSRSAEPHRHVGHPRRAPRRRSDHPADHPLHGRSRSALQPGGHHRSGSHRRARHTRWSQTVGRRRRHRPCRCRRQPGRTGAGACNARSKGRPTRESWATPSCSACKASRACCRPSSTSLNATASSSPTSRSPRPASKPSSSPSPGRTSANDRHHGFHHWHPDARARCARAAPRRSARCSCVT